MIEIRKRYFVLWFHASIATFLSKQSRTKYAPQPPFFFEQPTHPSSVRVFIFSRKIRFVFNMFFKHFLQNR